jgi:hypothetical protein
MTSTAVAERNTSKTSAKKAEPKAQPLWFNPGKPAREASSEGERKREAQDAVPPSMEGGNATLVNAFLQSRFLWLVEGVEGNGIHTVWGAEYDLSHDAGPTDPDEAERRATHVGQGRTVAEAKRAIMTAMVAADPKLQARYRKPVTPRVTVPEPAKPEAEKPEAEVKTPAKKATAKRTSRKAAEPKPETTQVTETTTDETTPASS